MTNSKKELGKILSDTLENLRNDPTINYFGSKNLKQLAEEPSEDLCLCFHRQQHHNSGDSRECLVKTVFPDGKEIFCECYYYTENQFKITLDTPAKSRDISD